MADSSDSDNPHARSEPLRTPQQLLRAFGGVAARFPTQLRVVAFRDAVRGDGLVTVPASFLPTNKSGQPVVGQLNIGGTGKAVFGHEAVFYGIGGARLLNDSEELNVGFVLYGPSDDDAAARFRELGNEAGVVVHADELVSGIQSYDRPLVLWALIVYATLQGSTWLSQLDSIPENPTLHFNPFTASVETLKRLVAGTKANCDGDSKTAAGPIETKPKTRVRRKAGYEIVQRESQLAAEWERARDSGVYKADFAKQKEMTSADLDKLLDRVAKRKSRSDK